MRIDGNKMNKAIFVGIFSAIFSTVVLYLLITQIGTTGVDEMDEMISYMPFLIGAAVGFYAGKFTFGVFASRL